MPAFAERIRPLGPLVAFGLGVSHLLAQVSHWLQVWHQLPASHGGAGRRSGQGHASLLHDLQLHGSLAKRGLTCLAGEFHFRFRTYENLLLDVVEVLELLVFLGTRGLDNPKPFTAFEHFGWRIDPACCIS